MTEAPHMSLGGRLRWERERRHWTQKELAAQIEVTELSVIRWEQDQVKPRNYGLKKLEELFGPMEGWGGKLTRLWTVPYMRNLYFTGREHILKLLHTALGGREVVAVSQARAISGLGGIGKTQTAVEYAYLYGREYTLVLWVRADSRAVLVAQLAGLAAHFGLPNHAQADQQLVAKAVKHWLETQEEQVWLLIFDNVDDIVLVKEFLPTKGTGAVLLTTRLQAVGTHIRKIDLDTLTLEEGIQFFQARVGIGGEPGSKVLSETERQAAEQLYMLLGGLPLALEQAAAYMEERKCSLADYVPLYEKQRAIYLTRRPNPVDPEDYPHSVATTWLVSFQQVEQAGPAAVDLLRLCAFLHPDAIPEDLLQAVTENPKHVQTAIDIVKKYSLIQHQPETRTLTIHRLVQAVIQDGLEETERRAWARKVVLALNAVFPAPEEQDDWQQCERLLPHALLAAHYIEEQNLTSEEAGRLLHETASYLQDRARFSEAEPLFQRALQIREQILGPEHLDVAASLNGLADLHREQGKPTEAEPRFQRALRIREEQLGPQHILVSISLANLANLYRDQGKHSEAEALYQRAHQIIEQSLESEHPQFVLSQRNLAIRYGRVLSNLAALYLEHGKYVEAEPLFQRALQTFEPVVGSEHLDLAPPLSNLAILYKEQGRYAEAEPLYLRSQHIWEHVLGPEHPQLALAFNNLAELYKEEERYAEAEPLYQNARRLWEHHLGPNHLLIAIVSNNLADIFCKQGRFMEAESLYEQALRLFEQSGGPEYYLTAYALNGMANLCAEQRRFTEAEALYERALHIRRKVWGSVHPETAETIYDLARLREAQGNPEEARNWYEQALALREQTLGAHHPKTRQTRQRLIALLQTMRQGEQAAPLELVQLGQEPNNEG